MKAMKLCALMAACSLVAMSAAEARAVSSACASAAEIHAIQVAAVHQELTDAALACGPKSVSLYNRFQTTFNRELRRSDATMLNMFKRINGNARGNAAYDSFKTRTIARAEIRRTKPGAHDNFCRTAELVFAAALAPDKPILEDFVSGVPVNETSPVDSCEIKVAVALQGVQAGPDIMPTARPDLPSDGQSVASTSAAAAVPR